MQPQATYERLAKAGILERAGAEWRTTETWQRAFMKAEEQALEFNEAVNDPRVPVSYALVSILGADVPEAELEQLIDGLLPIELKEEQEMELDEDVDEDGEEGDEEEVVE